MTGWRFPGVRGRTLLGREVALPRDLPADRTLVVLAFQRWHQARVDGWIARAVVGGTPAARPGLSRSPSSKCPSCRLAGDRCAASSTAG